MKKIEVNMTSSDGIAIGKAYIMKKVDLKPQDYKVNNYSREDEITRYEKAVEQAQSQISILSKASDIFEGHLMLIKDSTLKASVVGRICNRLNAEQALSETINEFAEVFTNSEDVYLKERSVDIKDIGNRILRAMKNNIHEETLPYINEAVIMVAQELAPSDIPEISAHNNIKGIITQNGSVASHVSLLAQNYKIPALIGVKDILSKVNQGDLLIMDATEGIILINPEQETYFEYIKKSEEYSQSEKSHIINGNAKAVTSDGRRIKLLINAGNVEEASLANVYGTDGIGLFRSEIMFMQCNSFPGEEEQFATYKAIAQTCNGTVIIRALDIGGDKELPYYKIKGEGNPFLGWRGIRVLLDNEELFKSQLRAILRASFYGNIKLLLPMITSVDEFIRAKALLEQCKNELREMNIQFDENLQTGIMVETPAVVINIYEFAKLVDFLSIGTNDLTQYILAADRNNQRVVELYSSFHPAVLRSINMIIKAGRKYNKKVGLCGELAGDYRATKLLIGMGLEELSMSAKHIAKVKSTIYNTDFEQAQLLAKKILRATSTSAVMRLLL